MIEHHVIDIKTGRPLERDTGMNEEQWRHAVGDSFHQIADVLRDMDRRIKRLERPWYKKLPFMRKRRHDD